MQGPTSVLHSIQYLNLPKPTFCRVPINSILGFIIRTYKKVGFGSLRYCLNVVLYHGMFPPSTPEGYTEKFYVFVVSRCISAADNVSASTLEDQSLPSRPRSTASPGLYAPHNSSIAPPRISEVRLKSKPRLESRAQAPKSQRRREATKSSEAFAKSRACRWWRTGPGRQEPSLL